MDKVCLMEASSVHWGCLGNSVKTNSGEVGGEGGHWDCAGGGGAESSGVLTKAAGA